MSDEQTASPLERFEDLLASEDDVEEAAPEEASEELEDDAGQAEDDAESEDADAPDEEAETDGEEDDDADDAEPVGAIEVEINGQTRTLTADEVRDGILMRSDYTRKTQELANERAKFDAEREQAAAQIRQQFEAVQALRGDEQEPDWDKLYDEDPLGAPKIERQWRAKQAERQQMQQQMQHQREAQKRQHMAQQAALLPELIPEWQDQSRAKAEQAELQQALIDDGFSPEDVAMVSDARLVKWLRAAHQHMKGQKAAKETVKKKVAGKPRVQKPGSAKPKSAARSQVKANREIARKTQSKDAWTKVFEDLV